MEPPAGPARPRSLGLWSATALVFGHTIGVGIFLTPAELIGAVGSPALTLALWLGCGALVLAGAFSFGELASRFPETGGVYVFLRKAWGDRVAFLYGWQSLLVTDPGLTAALAAGLAQYLVVLLPGAAGAERWVALVTIWILTLANLAGLRLSARVFNALTAFKVLALVGIMVGALTATGGSWSHLTPFLARRPGGPPIGEALGLGLVGAFFSFAGFWEMSRVAGEVRDPGRVLPRAFAIGVAAVTLVYLGTTVAFLYLVPATEAITAAAFARSVGQAILGQGGPAALALVVVISVMASTMALLLMAPRLYLAMSERGVFPAGLARLSPGTGAPARATLLLGVLASGYVLTGSFQQIVAYFMATTLVFIGLAAAGLVVLRRRDPGAGAFRAPGYPVTTGLFVSLLAVIVVLIVVARPLPALGGIAVVSLGLVGYPILTRAR